MMSLSDYDRILRVSKWTSSIVQFMIFSLGPLRSAEIFREIRHFYMFRPMYSKQVFIILIYISLFIGCLVETQNYRILPLAFILPFTSNPGSLKRI